MFDVVTFGESMIRLNPPGFQRIEQSGVFEVQVGGSESNTAVALSRLGRKVSWWSRLPRNPLGRRIETEIRKNGVDTSRVIWQDGRAGLYFLEFGTFPRQHEITYDRAESAASRLQPEDIDPDLLKDSRHLHLTGITPALSASCSETMASAIQQARVFGLTVSFDLNYRRKLWDPATARLTLESTLPSVNLLMTPEADAAEVLGTVGSAQAAAAELTQRYGIPNVVVTLGAGGAAAQTASGAFSSPAFDSVEVDRLGGGDAFNAGVIDGFLDGDLETGLRRGCAMAALKRTMQGDMLLTTPEEIERTMTGSSSGILR